MAWKAAISGGLVGASLAYFSCEAGHQSWSCMFAGIAVNCLAWVDVILLQSSWQIQSRWIEHDDSDDADAYGPAS